MLRLFSHESEQSDTEWFDLADVVASLHLPELSWTAEDIFVNVSKDPGLDVAELEQVSSAPHLPNPVLDSASFARLAEATHQFIEGEFVGFHPFDVGKIDKAVIRLDMSDGSLWTIIIDTDQVKIGDTFSRVFGSGTQVPAMTTRATGPSTEMPS
ncbi:hypothetical protein [Curtobacterium aurantiacum]|uniref:hypothetical protein n=1 Tax=Curtobacterium aurantiacum TaxID=3236919 RepID=UPI001BE00918|nr:hypothetical protein [Curtobacterium flaccumfaciens]MBT1675779.1 hypothetical protein [Curtobacterium flaccumfaciens pv. flaccumfaciens]